MGSGGPAARREIWAERKTTAGAESTTCKSGSIKAKLGSTWPNPTLWREAALCYKVKPVKATGFPTRLSAAGLVVVLVGAAGSLALMLYASRHQDSRVLLLLFGAWVLSPFMAPVLTNVVPQRWSILSRATLNITMLLITWARWRSTEI